MASREPAVIHKQHLLLNGKQARNIRGKGLQDLCSVCFVLFGLFVFFFVKSQESYLEGALPFGEWKSQGPGARNCKAPTVSLQRCPPAGDPGYLRSIQKHTWKESLGFLEDLPHGASGPAWDSGRVCRDLEVPGLRLCGCCELVNTGAVDKVPDDITGSCLLLSLY